VDEVRRIYGERDDLELVDDPYEALEEADALVVVTEWKIFRSPDLSMMKQRMRQAVIFDGRNIFDPEQISRHGFDYRGIGRISHA
jgi:UDPglucose 6-dehydrogenase